MNPHMKVFKSSRRIWSKFELEAGKKTKGKANKKIVIFPW
jgi:hypothetical protein